MKREIKRFSFSKKEGKRMVGVSKGGKGKTLYIRMSVYPCGEADTGRNLTISCPHKDTRFKTTLSDNGLRKFRKYILNFYNSYVTNKNLE